MASPDKAANQLPDYKNVAKVSKLFVRLGLKEILKYFFGNFH